MDSKYTTLLNVTVVNSISGVELFKSAKIQVLNSTIAITTINDSTNAVSISSSSDVLLHNITINSSVVISDATDICINSVTIIATKVKFAMSAYKSSNIMIENYRFIELGIPEGDITAHPAVVFL